MFFHHGVPPFKKIHIDENSKPLSHIEFSVNTKCQRDPLCPEKKNKKILALILNDM